MAAAGVMEPNGPKMSIGTQAEPPTRQLVVFTAFSALPKLVLLV